MRTYDEKVDMWSAGCILAELLDHTPIFTGSTDLDQLARIARIIGLPSEGGSNNNAANWYSQVPEYAKLNLHDARRIDFEEHFSSRLATSPDSAIRAIDLL